MKIKSKQHWAEIKTLFSIVKSKVTVPMIKQLTGINQLSQTTPVFRIDHYFGKCTVSVGWLLGVHPTYINAEHLVR